MKITYPNNISKLLLAFGVGWSKKKKTKKKDLRKSLIMPCYPGWFIGQTYKDVRVYALHIHMYISGWIFWSQIILFYFVFKPRFLCSPRQKINRNRCSLLLTKKKDRPLAYHGQQKKRTQKYSHTLKKYSTQCTLSICLVSAWLSRKYSKGAAVKD